MAGRKTFQATHLAFALILILLISCNSCRKYPPTRRTSGEVEYKADPSPSTSPLIDSNGRVALEDESAVVESDPDITAKAVKPYMDDEKKRDKRFVMLLPMAAMIEGISASTALTAAAVGVGATAAVVAAENRRKGLPPPGQNYHPSPKTEDITGFPGLVKKPSRTPVKGGGGRRNRWKDEKNKKYFEWDSENGELEKYDKNGKHEGAFDPYTGEKRGDAVPGRKIDV